MASELPKSLAEQITLFRVSRDFDRLQRIAEEMFAPLAAFRRREVYRYQAELRALVELQQRRIEELERGQ